MLHGYLDYLKKTPLGGRPNTKPGDHGTPNTHNRWYILFLTCVRTRMNQKIIEIAFGWVPGHIWLHTTCFWRCVGTTAFGHSLSFGLSQFHGHGFWLMCDVALTTQSRQRIKNICNNIPWCKRIPVPNLWLPLGLPNLLCLLMVILVSIELASEILIRRTTMLCFGWGHPSLVLPKLGGCEL